jgi:hypothetical protein
LSSSKKQDNGSYKKAAMPPSKPSTIRPRVPLGQTPLAIELGEQISNHNHSRELLLNNQDTDTILVIYHSTHDYSDDFRTLLGCRTYPTSQDHKL